MLTMKIKLKAKFIQTLKITTLGYFQNDLLTMKKCRYETYFVTNGQYVYNNETKEQEIGLISKWRLRNLSVWKNE